jgi:hypothetical protein
VLSTWSHAEKSARLWALCLALVKLEVGTLNKARTMLANFERIGVRFHYPDNWELDGHALLAGDREVTVYSPGGAYWTLSIYPREAKPKEILSDIVDAMKAEYENLDFEPLDDPQNGYENHGYEFNFYYLDLTSTAVARVFTGVWANYVIFYQAEDREFAELTDVFAAMTLSFLNESNIRQINSDAELDDADEHVCDDGCHHEH